MYCLEEIMEPIWEGKMVRKESIVFSEENKFIGTLLYHPDKISKVESSDLKKEYLEGKDYVFRNGEIILTEHTSIPKLFTNQIYPAQYKVGQVFGCVKGGYIRYSEEDYWHQHQTYVTYETNEKAKEFPLLTMSKILPKTFAKLYHGGDTLRIVLFGDSISEGYNASGFIGAEPFMPSYGELVVRFAQQKNKRIWLKNTSLAGKDTRWALKNVRERICRYYPDLVIIAFGMNDGTAHISGGEFKNNIKKIQEIVLDENANCEFILVSPILPNSEACLLDSNRTPFMGEQEEYIYHLQTLREEGTEILDMTAIHRWLLKKKKYSDMTGNNVNHPNDYMIRWYAQGICALLGMYE